MERIVISNKLLLLYLSQLKTFMFTIQLNIFIYTCHIPDICVFKYIHLTLLKLFCAYICCYVI